LSRASRFAVALSPWTTGPEARATQAWLHGVSGGQLPSVFARRSSMQHMLNTSRKGTCVKTRGSDRRRRLGLDAGSRLVGFIAGMESKAGIQKMRRPAHL